MAATDCEPFDAESLEELFEPTVEVPAALLLAGGCGCCGGCFARSPAPWRCC